MDETKWAKYLLESVYTVWFVLFSLKIKSDAPDYYEPIVDYSMDLLDDMKARVI